MTWRRMRPPASLARFAVGRSRTSITSTRAAWSAIPVDSPPKPISGVDRGCGGSSGRRSSACCATLAGAIVLYGFGVITGFAVGYLTIFVGFMIGTAVMKGTDNRGGRKYQVLAALLTYSAVAWSFTPLVIKGVFQNAKAHQAAKGQKPRAGNKDQAKPQGNAHQGANVDVDDVDDADPPDQANPPPLKASKLVLALLVVSAFVLVLTYLSPFLGLPYSLFVLMFILLGMRQSWRLTRRTEVVFDGPFLIGEDRTAGVGGPCPA